MLSNVWRGGSHVPVVLAVACIACFLAGRWSSPQSSSHEAFIRGHSAVPASPPHTPPVEAASAPASSPTAAQPAVSLAALTALTPTCSWPVETAPLAQQEWLDKATMTVRFPYSSGDTNVYATQRRGAPYEYAEFWETVSSATWEEHLFKFFSRVLQGRVGVHLDIGAWIGPTSLHAARFATHVYSFEPDPRAFSELHANVLLNPQLAAKMTLMRQCVSNVSGDVEMTGPSPMGSSMSRVNGLAAIPNKASDENHWGQRMVSWPARCTSIPDFAQRAQLSPTSVSLIKIDTEGAEGLVVRSVKAWLDAALPRSQGIHWPTLFIEMHPSFWSDASATTASIVAIVRTYAHVYIIQGGGLAPINIDEHLASQNKICDSFCPLVASDSPISW